MDELREDKVNRTVRLNEQIRDSNITNLSLSENLLAFKKVCRQIEGRGVTFVLPESYLEDIMQDGVNKIKELLGDDKRFTPLEEINKKGIAKYFEEVRQGRIESLKQEELILGEEDAKDKLRRNKEKSERRGNFVKVQEHQELLDLYDSPQYYQEKYAALRSALKSRGDENSILHEKYDQLEKKARKIVKNRNRDFNAMTYVKDIDYDLREFIGSLFFNVEGSSNRSADKYIKNYYGEVVLDYEHILLLYLYMEATNHEYIDKVKGLLYYIAIETFYREIKELIKIKKDTPFFDTGADTFQWKKYPQYTKKHMLYLMKPQGYNCYYIEPKNISQKAYLIGKGVESLDYEYLAEKYKRANQIMKEQENGIFFKFLTKDDENNLIPHILTENFPLEQMDGVYKSDLLDDFLIRHHKFEESNLSNMYNRIIKPYSLDMIGSVIYNGLYNLDNLIDKNLAYIYYVSPQRLGIAIREDIEDYSIDEIFGATRNMLKKVEEPTLDDIVFRGFCL